jgi:hypothetical protein
MHAESSYLPLSGALPLLCSALAGGWLLLLVSAVSERVRSEDKGHSRHSSSALSTVPKAAQSTQTGGEEKEKKKKKSLPLVSVHMQLSNRIIFFFCPSDRLALFDPELGIIDWEDTMHQTRRPHPYARQNAWPAKSAVFGPFNCIHN